MKFLLGLIFALSASMTRAPSEFVKSHMCLSQNEVSCVVEKTLVCPPGYLDGCITGETRNHKCLPSQDAPSCDIDLDLNCPENFEDACKTGELSVHLCVPVKGPLCTDGADFLCPSGFEDSCRK